MEYTDDLKHLNKEAANEQEALDQSLALNRIVMTMLQQQKETNKRLFIALVISLLMNAFIVGGFLYYNSLYDYTTTITTTTTTTTSDHDVEGDGAEINNVQGNQYKDSATHNEGVSD